MRVSRKSKCPLARTFVEQGAELLVELLGHIARGLEIGGAEGLRLAVGKKPAG
jgi:hypothetical protein